MLQSITNTFYDYQCKFTFFYFNVQNMEYVEIIQFIYIQDRWNF